ncbi:hypothetical protein JTB14_027656 [Gonioctena quinquepunctata]|nr:hypothetical protein JTB14_027656 [Gonioctena quinquepunctata]
MIEPLLEFSMNVPVYPFTMESEGLRGEVSWKTVIQFAEVWKTTRAAAECHDVFPKLKKNLVSTANPIISPQLWNFFIRRPNIKPYNFG